MVARSGRLRDHSHRNPRGFAASAFGDAPSMFGGIDGKVNIVAADAHDRSHAGEDRMVLHAEGPQRLYRA
jgi:hypothetical protein